MINTVNLLLESSLSFRLPLNSDNVPLFKEYLNKYKYPACKFPINFISNNHMYIDYSLDENINYLHSWIDALYDDMYTEKERNIIVTYLVLTYGHGSFLLTNPELQLIEPFLEEESDKDEIVYFLDELRYYYVGSLLTRNSPRSDIINPILQHLLEIEKIHNQFQITMGQDKNEIDR